MNERTNERTNEWMNGPKLTTAPERRVPKQRWLEMVRSRFWSTLSADHFTDDELAGGLVHSLFFFSFFFPAQRLIQAQLSPSTRSVSSLSPTDVYRVLYDQTVTNKRASVFQASHPPMSDRIHTTFTLVYWYTTNGWTVYTPRLYTNVISRLRSIE